MRRQVVLDTVREWFPQWQRERERLDRVDRWYRWEQEQIPLPKRATPELRKLADLSKTPWLGLVVASISQCMYVDGWRSPRDRDRLSDDDNGPWRTWLANGFDQRQIPVHRAALAYGYSYATVLPGEDGQGKRSVLRGVSPRKLYAVWGDASEHDWPLLALKFDKSPGGDWSVRLFDEEATYWVKMDTAGGQPEFISSEAHDAGVCPVVRFGMPDLEGRCDGQVEPFIPVAARINKTAYDRLLTQHFNSWKIRTVAGMAEPDDEEKAARKKLQLRQDDLLVAEDPDTKFDTLDETPLDGFVAAWRADIEALAAVTQTPTHALTGQLVNLSAEALAAARAGLTQKTSEWMKSVGRSHGQMLRLAAQLEGNLDDAHDHLGRVSWQDMEIRSMSQAVDALGKAAQMLNVPAEALWSRIPGVEKSDVDDWRHLAEQADPVTRMTDQLARQHTGPDPTAGP